MNRDVEQHVLAICVYLERKMLDITEQAIRNRMHSTDDGMHGVLFEMVQKGILAVTNVYHNNLRRYRVTNAGYAAAGVRPPVWMDQI